MKRAVPPAVRRRARARHDPQARLSSAQRRLGAVLLLSFLLSGLAALLTLRNRVPSTQAGEE